MPFTNQVDIEVLGYIIKHQNIISIIEIKAQTASSKISPHYTKIKLIK